jgi:hypothetical protein
MSDPSEWYHVGALISHSTFGTGEVVQVGDYDGVHAVTAGRPRWRPATGQYARMPIVDRG